MEANGRFLLRGVMGENGILWLISCLSLLVTNVVGDVGGLKNGMGATHFSKFVLVGGRASVVERSVAA